MLLVNLIRLSIFFPAVPTFLPVFNIQDLFTTEPIYLIVNLLNCQEIPNSNIGLRPFLGFELSYFIHCIFNKLIKQVKTVDNNLTA